MNFRILRQILKYPHKKCMLKYLLRNPSLVLDIPQKTQKFHFLKTLEDVLDADIVSCLHNFLPERFLIHLAAVFRWIRHHDG